MNHSAATFYSLKMATKSMPTRKIGSNGLQPRCMEVGDNLNIYRCKPYLKYVCISQAGSDTVSFVEYGREGHLLTYSFWDCGLGFSTNFGYDITPRCTKKGWSSTTYPQNTPRRSYFPEKAQKEIDAVVGRQRLPTLADRANLPYVDNVLKEVMRWGTPVPLGKTIIFYQG